MFHKFASILRLSLVAAAFTAGAATPTGPAIGERIPRFSAPDQNGRVQTLDTIAGSNGAMLVFYRSADW